MKSRARRRCPRALGLQAWVAVGLAASAEASNWAQTTGAPQQNNVVTRIPHPDIWSAKSGSFVGKNDHWTGRKGMAVVTVPYNASTGRQASIFVLGGDSYIRDSQYWEHGGEMLNDVWYTNGIEWYTTRDRELRVRVVEALCICIVNFIA